MGICQLNAIPEIETGLEIEKSQVVMVRSMGRVGAATAVAAAAASGNQQCGHADNRSADDQCLFEGYAGDGFCRGAA